MYTVFMDFINKDEYCLTTNNDSINDRKQINK